MQSFTASLEHYMFPELLAHPCVLTNMRGLFDHVIADQVMGYVICFARNLHTYMRNQLRAALRTGRRRVGEGQLVDRAVDCERDGSGDDLSSPFHLGDHRHGGDRV